MYFGIVQPTGSPQKEMELSKIWLMLKPPAAVLRQQGTTGVVLIHLHTQVPTENKKLTHKRFVL